jgi:phosphohistidine phosphatase
MRHGKSKRGPQYETDFERPLAKRGKRAAEAVGRWMAARGDLPDLILSSPAERARDTALRCAEAVDYAGEIRFESVLYFTTEDVYLELLWDLDDTIGSVLFVGHNPVTESVIETLCGAFVRMPTAALARIDFEIASWRELDENSGQLAWLQMPRELE